MLYIADIPYLFFSEIVLKAKIFLMFPCSLEPLHDPLKCAWIVNISEFATYFDITWLPYTLLILTRYSMCILNENSAKAEFETLNVVSYPQALFSDTLL